MDRHQLAGLDARERGFSRPVEVERAGEGYRAILRYETTHVATDLFPTPEEALRRLIRALHARGYRQLRTQRSFCDGLYLGSQELWMEYPDPQPPPGEAGLIARIVAWFRQRREERRL